MPYNPFAFLNPRTAKDDDFDSSNTKSGVKITDPDKPSSSTSPLPLNNPSAAMKEHLPLISSTSDDLNAHLPLMSSPSRSNRTVLVQGNASNPSDSLRISPQTTEMAQFAGDPSAHFGPDPPEVHDNIPSDSVPSPRSKTTETDEGDGSSANLGPDPPKDHNNLPSDLVPPSRSKTTETDEGDGSSANLGPDPPEDHNNLPSDPVPPSR